MRCGWCEDIMFALYVLTLLVLGAPAFLFIGELIWNLIT